MLSVRPMNGQPSSPGMWRNARAFGGVSGMAGEIALCIDMALAPVFRPLIAPAKLALCGAAAKPHAPRRMVAGRSKSRHKVFRLVLGWRKIKGIRENGYAANSGYACRCARRDHRRTNSRTGADQARRHQPGARFPQDRN